MFCNVDEDKAESDEDFEPTDAQLENYYWSGYERGEATARDQKTEKRLTGEP